MADSYNRQALMAVDPKRYADLREVPKYTIGEVASYLDLPTPSTVRWWCLGRYFKIGDERRLLAAANCTRPP